VHGSAGAVAAYFVQWTLGHVDRHGAKVDLIIGEWGSGAEASDRCSVSLEFRRSENGPAFMDIDPAGRLAASSELVGKRLARDEVVGTPLAQIAFTIVDALWVQDGRIAEVVGVA
jgi:hypothetical protein